jgi:hypothetical protein
MIQLRQHLTRDGHIVLGHGNIVLRFKRGDDTWTPEALERTHEELHASVAQRHTHREKVTSGALNWNPDAQPWGSV